MEIETVRAALQSAYQWIIGLGAGLGSTTVVAVVVTIIKTWREAGQRALAARRAEVIKAKNEEIKLLKNEIDAERALAQERERSYLEDLQAQRDGTKLMIEGMTYFVSGSKHSDECKASVLERLNAASACFPDVDMGEIGARAEKYAEQAKQAPKGALAEAQKALIGLKTVSIEK